MYRTQLRSKRVMIWYRYCHIRFLGTCAVCSMTRRGWRYWKTCLAVVTSVFLVLVWSSCHMGPLDTVLHYPRVLRGQLYRWLGVPLPLPGYKTILFWNSFFEWPDYAFGFGHEPFLTHKCPESRCFVSNDRYLLPIEEWDAIVFHTWDLDPGSVPWRRSPHQRYVLYTMEAPPVMPDTLGPFRDFFNWTMTYRYDSDITRPYGWVVKKPVGAVPPKDGVVLHVSGWSPDRDTYRGPDVAAGKTRMAAWFVSKCKTQSLREDLAKELAKHVQLDVYGGCGNLTCPSSSYWSCMGMVNRTYKFYLSFENSVCRDYATEKLFNALHFDLVPVVFGGADYSLLAPPGSYVDANLFPSVDALAQHLLRLDRNNTLYNQHFWWKQHYRVVGLSGDKLQGQGFCKMCRMLHLQDPRASDVPHTWYPDPKYWWDSPGTCKSGWGLQR